MQKLYTHRFDILLFSQLMVLFGGLLFPSGWFETYLIPVFFILNLLSAVLLFSKNKLKTGVIIALLLIAIFDFGIDIASKGDRAVNIVKLGTFFLFYVLLTIEIIKQVWYSKHINKNVIFGLINGYLSLGLIGFFICLSIELFHPGAFQGLQYTSLNANEATGDIIYYSYITLMTIGYGEIVPVIPIAKKGAVFIGLIGQLYLVVLTAIVVGKYINQNTSTK